MNTARQGDIYFREVSNMPKTVKKVVSGVITHSDHTNHTHRLVDGTLLALKDKQFIKVSKLAKVVHEEHKPIILKKGLYEVRRQKEYLAKDMEKVVQD